MAPTSADPILELLLRYLGKAREELLASLDGLGEYDVRRPLTPTGTNLLGLVKHAAGVELGYFGDCIGRPVADPPAWHTDAVYEADEDMWATPEESRVEIVALYRRVWEHTDAAVRELGLDAPAHVPWWRAGQRETTLGRIVVHQIDETAHHAGHADILRELIDGRGGSNRDDLGDDAWWRERVARIAADAERFA